MAREECESSSAQRLANGHLEAVILGGLLAQTSYLERYFSTLRKDYFLLEHHRRLWTCLGELHEKQLPITLTTLQSHYHLRYGPLEIGILTDLLEKGAVSDYELENAIETLKTLYTFRSVVEYCGDLAQKSLKSVGEWSKEDLLRQARAGLEAIEAQVLNGENAQGALRTHLAQYLEHLETRLLNPGGLSGLKTPFGALNALTGGLQRGDLIILAARPGMGKTALALQLATHFVVKEGAHGVFISLEMPEEQLVARMVCNLGGLSWNRCRKGLLDEKELQRLGAVVEQLKEAPLWITARKGVTPQEIEEICYQQKQRGQLDFVMIDYLQLLHVPGRVESRNLEISQIVQGCKALALSFNIPILLLSQLSREVEKRTEKRPVLSDLRDSGAIEQAADLVFFLYRPAYYEKERMYLHHAEEPVSTEGSIEEVELLLRKHRNGETGTVSLGFIPQQMRFVELDTEHEIAPLRHSERHTEAA